MNAAKAPEKRWRVAVVCPAFSHARGGGMERATYALVQEIQKTCDVTIIAARCEGTETFGAVRSIILPALPFFHFHLQYLTFRYAWEIYRRCARPRRRFDIIYSMDAVFEGADFAAVHFNNAAYLRVMRATPHPPAGLRLALKRAYHVWHHGVSAAEERRAFGRIATGRSRTFLLPVSPSVARSLEIEYGLGSCHMRVMPNPIDLALFHPGPEEATRQALLAAAGWDADSFLLLFVGGSWQRKGLAVAFETLTRLPPRAKLVVVGPGNALEFGAIAAGLGVRDRVHFAGVRRDVDRLYRATDLMVLPSSYETFGLCCLEAMASARPVVVTPFGGTEACVRDGVTGFIRSTSEGFADAARKLMDDPALRETLGREAEQSARRFSAPAVAAELLDLFGARLSADRARLPE
jgi:glycosyltransferase involved in cell wall biosynthesis